MRHLVKANAANKEKARENVSPEKFYLEVFQAL